MFCSQRFHAGRSRTADDRGMATAELAITLPVLLLVVGALVWSLSVAGAHLACGAAAREAARALARGESAAVVRAGGPGLPHGARVVLAEEPGAWRVSVVLSLKGTTGLAALLPAVEVRGSAVAAKEPPP